jgi:hypothetical protein
MCYITFITHSSPMYLLPTLFILRARNNSVGHCNKESYVVWGIFFHSIIVIYTKEQWCHILFLCPQNNFNLTTYIGDYSNKSVGGGILPVTNSSLQNTVILVSWTVSGHWTNFRPACQHLYNPQSANTERYGNMKMPKANPFLSTAIFTLSPFWHMSTSKDHSTAISTNIPVNQTATQLEGKTWWRQKQQFVSDVERGHLINRISFCALSVLQTWTIQIIN